MARNHRKSHHVIPSPRGGWSVLKGGSRRASRRFDTKKQAVDYGRRLSRRQGTAFYIHRRDGTIQRKSSRAHERHAPRDRDTR